MPRRLGQHFLREASVEKLLRAIAPAADEVFLEIGPGRGALTLPLARRAARVVAVEIDARLADALAAHAPANVEIVRADALAVDLRALVPEGGRLVGNLPYYVSSPLMRRFLALRGHVRDLHVMLQDEVARRIASPPGSRECGKKSPRAPRNGSACPRRTCPRDRPRAEAAIAAARVRRSRGG